MRARRALHERAVRATPAPNSFPEPAVSYTARARACLSIDDLAGAEEALRLALSLGSQDTEVAVMLASIHARRGETAVALHQLKCLLQSGCTTAAAYDTLGNILRMDGRSEEAITHYRKALLVDGDCTSALSNLALCLQDLGSVVEARQLYERAIAADPANPTVRSNFATLLFDLGEFENALNQIEHALTIDPRCAEAHTAMALGLLRRGCYERGWQEYEWRNRDFGRAHPSPSYPEWNGAKGVAGHLLICSEQGLGDQIMFASCLGELCEHTSCIIECDPRLAPIFSRSFPKANVYRSRKRSTEPWLTDGVEPSAKTWIGSLPLRSRSQPTDFPGTPYLLPDPSKVAAWSLRLRSLGEGLKVGISWRGGTATTRSALRSVALDMWAPILREPNLHFISLQYGDCGAEIERAQETCGVSPHHWPEAIADYDQTAALVCALDLVVSVQTSVVHLAGALGKPVWVLVPQIPEWRYGEDSESMVWYPSARLFRQQESGWQKLMEKIQREVQQLSVGIPPART